MSKQEFIDKLRMSLSGYLSSVQVMEHIRFYEEYIRSEMMKGKSEAEVMQMLGDPRLIAKTILDTAEYTQEGTYSDGGTGENYGYRQYNGGYTQNTGYTSGYTQQRATNGYDNAGYDSQSTVHKVSLPGWVKLIIGVVIFFCIISLIFSVLSFLMPFIVPILIIVFVTKLFKDWLK